MKRWLGDDVTAILAIAYGFTISVGITGGLLRRERFDPAPVEVSRRYVPDGYQTVRVEVNDTKIGSVGPGSRVDVVGVLTPANADAEGVAETVVRDLEVLASYRRFSRDVDAEIMVVTLLAKARDVKRLEIAAAQGRPDVLLRSGSESP